MLNPNEYLDMLPMLAEFAKTRPDAWKKFVEERDKLSTAGQYRGLRKDMYEIKGSNVESMLSNVVAKELDIRNPNRPNKIAQISNTLFVTADLSINSTYGAEEAMNLRTYKNMVKSISGEKKELAEFLIACYEEVLTMSFAYAEDVDISQKMNGFDPLGEMTSNLGEFQSAEMCLAQMFIPLIQGEDIQIHQIHLEREKSKGQDSNEYESREMYRNRIREERGKIIYAADHSNIPADAMAVDLFNYNLVFEKVSSRPEFQKFRGITADQLCDFDYRHRLAQSGEYRLPDRMDFQIKTNEIIDPAAFVEFMEKKTEPERKALVEFYNTNSAKAKKGDDIYYIFKSYSSLPEEVQTGCKALVGYMEYGSTWYNDNIGCMIQKDTHQLLEEAGLDWTDMIFIGDKSLREIVGSQYDDMPKELAEKEKQARVTAAVIKAEEPVSFGVMEKAPDGKIRLARVIPVYGDVLPFQKTEAEKTAYRKKQEALNASPVFAEQEAAIRWKMKEYKPAYSNAYTENHVKPSGSDTLKYMTGGLDPESFTSIWHGYVPLAFNELNKPGRVNSLTNEIDRKAAMKWKALYDEQTDPKKKDTVKAMYELQRCGVRRTEPTRSHGSFFESILYLNIKAKHPEYHMSDIMCTDRCENQELADQIRLEKEAMGPQIMAKMGTTEGLADVMKVCMRTVSGLDLGREADYAAKIPETLTVEERKELCKRPEYEGARAGFFVTLGGAIQGLTQGLESAGGFTKKVPPVKVTNENRAVFNKYPEALKLREKIGELSVQELAEFNHAVEAVIKVSDLNRNKAQFMGDGKRDQISDAELAACAEATILNEQLEERGRIGGKKIATGRAGTLLPLVADIPSQERPRMMRGHLPETLKEAYFNDEGIKKKLTDDAMGAMPNISKEEESVLRYLSTPESERKFKPEAVPAHPLYDITKFSKTATLPEDVVIRMQEENAKRAIVTNTVLTFLEEHKIDNPGDTRDFSGMIDTKGLDNAQIEEKTKLALEDYYSGDPQRRKKVLDEFYNRAESFDLRSLDLSLLTTNPPRDPAKRAKSAEDLVRLYEVVVYDQTRETKLKENPEYRADRYSDPEKHAQYVHLEKGLKMVAPYFYQVVFANSGYDQALKVHDVKMMRASVLPECTASMIVETKRFYDRAAHMEGKKTDGVLPFVAVSEMENLLDVRKNPERNAAGLSAQLRTLYISEFQTDKKEWEKGGITQLSQIFFIDGKTAEEYCGNRFSNLPEQEREKRIEAEIMTAIASGEHHVDIATMSPTKEGTLDIQMYSIKADLHALDKKQREKEGMFASLISKKADKTWNNDKDRASRLEKEQQNLSERMVSTIQRKIQEKDELARQSTGAEVKQAPQAPAAGEEVKQAPQAPAAGAEVKQVPQQSSGGKTAVKIASTLEEMCSIQKNADQAQALQKAEKAPAAPEAAAKANIPGRTELKLDLTAPVAKTGEVTASPEKSNKKTI